MRLSDVASQMRADWYLDEGWRAYDAYQYERAEEAFSRAAEIGEAFQAKRHWAAALIGLANTLLRLERPAEAMTAVSGVFPGGPASGPTALTFDAYRVWADAALSLHLSASAIEKVLVSAEAYLRPMGPSAGRQTLLYLRADLLIRRGSLDAAIDSLIEGWSARRPDDPLGLAPSAHLNALCWALCQVGRIAEARHWIGVLRAMTDDGQLFAQGEVLATEVSLALAEGRPEEAVRLAQHSVSLLPPGASADSRSRGLKLAYCQAASHRPEEAARTMAALAGVREGPAWRRFELLELIGDIHLSAARRELGLPGKDPDYTITGPVAAVPDGCHRDPLTETRRARYFYQLAERHARDLDARVEGRHYTERLHRRYRLLDKMPSQPY